MFATYSRYIKYEYVNKYNANGVVTETGKRNAEQHGINDSKFHLPSWFFFENKRYDAKYVHIAVDFGFFVMKKNKIQHSNNMMPCSKHSTILRSIYHYRNGFSENSKRGS